MKLLTRSIYSYLIYAFIIILIAIPAFYFVIQAIVSEEVDEGLAAQKAELVQNLTKKCNTAALEGMSDMGILFPSNSTEPISDRFDTEVKFDKISGENIPYRIMLSSVILCGKHYEVRLARSLIDRNDLIESIVQVMIVLLLLIVGGFLVINQAISKSIWKPFYGTVNQLTTYTLAHTKLPIFDKTDIQEFKDLNDSISILIERNVKAFRSQQEFTENASHEMQTPLAVFQGKLELLMQTNPLSPSQAELIGDLSDASQRMNRLNRSLLLLSNIENYQFLEKETNSLENIVEEVLKQFAFPVSQKGITILCKIPTHFTIEANKALLEILITNMISNAIRHTPANGSVIISSEEKGVLIFRNTAGEGSLDQARIFERFYKHSTDSASTGLGLAIVSKICALSNYNFVYKFEEGMHVFSIYFLFRNGPSPE